jgi:hypothetical protein
MAREARLSEIITTAESVLERARRVRIEKDIFQRTLVSEPTPQDQERRQDIDRQRARVRSACDLLTEACERRLYLRDPNQKPTPRF